MSYTTPYAQATAQQGQAAQPGQASATYPYSSYPTNPQQIPYAWPYGYPYQQLVQQQQQQAAATANLSRPATTQPTTVATPAPQAPPLTTTFSSYVPPPPKDSSSSFNNANSSRTTARRQPSMRGLFSKELPKLMYGFGDDKQVSNDTVNVMEEILIEYLINLCHTAVTPAKKSRLQQEDLRRALGRRGDEKKLARMEELLFMSEDIRRARRQFPENELGMSNEANF